jgi:hypothetical protein
MHRVGGGCHCENIRVEIDLTREPGTYNPRACDCDFCQKHGAAYVSDVHGSLVIRIKDQRAGGRYRQGSGQAEFLLCKNCGVLVGILHSSGGRLYGAVNVNALSVRADFAAEQPVSPKRLSGAEKTQRWQELWFRNVNIVEGQDLTPS